MQKRTVFILAAAALLLCALAIALYLRWKAPPEVARLLPESDAIVYLNLKPLRAATHFDRNPVPPSLSYQQFTDATGIVVERDLDAGALALNRMPDPGGPNGPVGFSEVFVGRFDPERLNGYLNGLSTARESYADHTIYVIPSEKRMLRVAVLDSDMVAGSNMPTAEQIHSILDRHRSGASWFAGSSLLSGWYKDVPALSSAWAIGKIGLPFAEHGRIAVAGLELPLSPEVPFVAGLGVSPLHPGTVAARVDGVLGDEAQAARSVDALTGLLGLLRSLEIAQGAAGLRQVTDSIVIKQSKDRVMLTATIPMKALEGLGSR